MSSKPRDRHGRVADNSRYEDASDNDDDYDIRPSTELLGSDHDLLESEDERERLLTQKEGISGLFSSGVKIGRRDNSRKRSELTERKRSPNTGTSTPTYDTEEGIGASNSSLLQSRRTSANDEQRLHAIRAQKKACHVSPLRSHVIQLTTSADEVAKAMVEHYFVHLDHWILLHPPHICVPPFKPSGQPSCSIHSYRHLEWNISLRTNHHIDIA